MPDLEDLKHFGPWAIVGLCLVLGKAIKGSKLPDHLIPPILTGIGLLSGIATAIAMGGDWRAWLTGAIAALAGPAAVGLHQTGRSMARQSTAPPAPEPRAINVVMLPTPPPSNDPVPVVVPSDPNKSSR